MKRGRTEEENKTASRRLREAAKAGDVEGLRAAIEEGGDVNSFQEEGERRETQWISHCSLYLAACPIYGRSEECVRVLVEANADVDIADEEGLTVLIYACRDGWYSFFDLEKFLLEAGANVNHQCHAMRTALSHACWAIEGGSSRGRRARRVNLLIHFGADPNLAGKIGAPLMGAALSKDLESMLHLIESGANVNAVDEAGETALFFAGSVEAAALLLRNGADPRIRNRKGNAAFQQSIRFRCDCAQLFKNWTPHQMLPQWNPSVFPLYIDHCPGLKAAIKTTLLVFLRYRHIIPRNIGMQIIIDIANRHREEQLWPIEGFSMEPFMVRN